VRDKRSKGGDAVHGTVGLSSDVIPVGPKAYSPECVEGAFKELRVYKILGNPHGSIPMLSGALMYKTGMIGGPAYIRDR
jgi:hypothetical protein